MYLTPDELIFHIARDPGYEKMMRTLCPEMGERRFRTTVVNNGKDGLSLVIGWYGYTGDELEGASDQEILEMDKKWLLAEPLSVDMASSVTFIIQGEHIMMPLEHEKATLKL